MPQPMPPADVALDEDLVRALLADQHPDLSGLAVRRGASGWDNALYRLGDDLVVRLPRRAVGAKLVEHELRWLPLLAPLLPLPVPAPVRAGRPALGYPYVWSICPWFDGDTAVESPPSDGTAAAAVLGEFVAALHQPAPPDAPRNDVRGVPLAARDDRTRRWIAELSPERQRIALPLWDDAVAAPRHEGDPVFVHGDLHPGNLLVHGGRLRAVIDFGDMCAADPAVDLAAGWMLLDEPHRRRFRAAAGACDDAAWLRAQGWALTIGSATYANSADNPLMHRMGDAILTRVLER